MLVSSLEFLRTDKILLGLFCFILLCFEALCRVSVGETESHFSATTILVLPIILEKCGLGDWMILVHTCTLGRGDGRIAQWLRGSSSAEHFTLFTALEAESQTRALVLVCNLCLSNFSEVRRPVMKITFREMFGK